MSSLSARRVHLRGDRVQLAVHGQLGWACPASNDRRAAAGDQPHLPLQDDADDAPIRCAFGMESRPRSIRPQLTASAALAVLLSGALAGCQLGDYTAPSDDDCARRAGDLVDWLGDLHPIDSVGVIDARADSGTNECDLSIWSRMPEGTRRATLLPVARSIVAHLAGFGDTVTVRISHGDRTAYLTARSDPAEIAWWRRPIAKAGWRARRRGRASVRSTHGSGQPVTATKAARTLR